MKKIYVSLLKRAAHRWIKRHDPYVIGVTGSIGKTTCRMTITDVLRQTYTGIRISTSEKNFNTEIGLVLALFEIQSFTTHPIRVFRVTCMIVWKALFGNKRYDVIVLEYGIDHPGDMEYLLSIVQPHMSIFTGLDKVHAAYFESIDQLLAEKMKLMQGTREIVFVPVQTTYVEPYLESLEIDVLTYDLLGDDGGDIGFDAHELIEENENIYTEFVIRQETQDIMEVRTNMLGKEYAGYISLGVEIGMILERRLSHRNMYVSDTHISGEKREYLCVQQAGRYGLFGGQFGSILIDSTYNAAPKSMQKVIENTIRLRQKVYPERDLIYCLGDMRELGEFAESEHRQLAGQVAQSADAVYLIGEWMTSVFVDELLTLGYKRSDIFVYTSSIALGEQLLNDIEHRQRLSLILFKGSQNTIFLEEAVKLLLKNDADIEHLCRQSTWWLSKKSI